MSRPHDTTRPRPLAPELIRAVAARQPSAPAIVDGDRTVTYQAFEELVAAVAGELAHLPPTSRVAVCCRRSPEAVAAYLACLSLGICYVPVDSAQPAARIAALAARADVHHALVDQELRTALPVPTTVVAALDGGRTWPDVRASEEHTAYLMFTSGSTGKPKGAMVSQANLAGYLRQAVETYALRPSDRVYQVASLGFDWSVSEIFPALAAGATLVLRSDASLTTADQLAHDIDRHQVTVAHLPTALWHALAPAFTDGSVPLPPTLRHITIGGEQVLREPVRAWVERHGHRVRLLNTYGPTECTVEATTVELAGPQAIDVAARDVIPIGKPLPTASIYVLDDDGKPVCPKSNGRIFIGGPLVGQGYYNDPDGTDRRFVPDPFAHSPGARMYDTGDIGYWNDYDELVFVGRSDNQVKIGGYRVELEEIEHEISRHESVREVAVVRRPETATLCAYLTVSAGQSADDIRSWLSERVPPHLVPTQLVVVDALPRTLNDKVDRAALAALAAAAPSVSAGDDTADQAGDELETAIAKIWSQVLGLDVVAPTDDFFRLGGHSVLGMRLIGKLKKEISPAFTWRDLFEARTVRGLADRVRAREDADRGSSTS